MAGKRRWTKDLILAEALLYSTRAEFRRGSVAAYRWAVKERLEEAFSHMTIARAGRPFKPRFVYVIEAKEDGVLYVYVGLSINVDTRIAWHKDCGSVDKHMLLFSNPTCKVRVLNKGSALPEEDAARIEKETVERYKRKKNCVVLNRCAGGTHLGSGSRKWTLETLKAEAKKYKTRGAFGLGSNTAYQMALRYGVLDDVCGHMSSPRVPRNYWQDKEICRTAAAKCKSRSEFSKKFVQARAVSSVNGWLDEFFPK